MEGQRDYVKEHFDATMARDDARRKYEKSGSEEDRLAKEAAERQSSDARRAKEAYQTEQRDAEKSRMAADKAKDEAHKAMMDNWRAQMNNRKNPSPSNQKLANSAGQNYQNAKNHADNLRRQADSRNAGLNNPSNAGGGGGESSDGGSGSSGSTGGNELGSDTLKQALSDAGGNAKEGANKGLDTALAIGSKLSPKIAAAKTAKDGLDKSTHKTKSEKSARDLDAEEQQKQLSSGNIRMELSKGAIMKIGLIGGATALIMMLFISIITLIADEAGSFMAMGQMVADGDIKVEDAIKIATDVSNSVGTGSGDRDDPRYEYYKRFEILGNVFSTKYNCAEDKECAVSREEYIYFLKIADITLRYKNKYGVTLDWALLNATVMYNDIPKETIMGYHQNDYNEEDVENYNILMNLDWDYDYKKISGYNYLSADDYRFDLQILAKNMVRKTTTQVCTKTITDGAGNVTGIQVVAERTDLDVEDQYLQPGQPYYLHCPAGTSYSISSNYKVDKDKYNDFLLEYLEYKFYLDAQDYYGEDNTGTVIIDSVTGDSMSAVLVNLALSQQGISGRPNKFINWLTGGGSYPWCATFVSWVVAHTEYNGQKMLDVVSVRSAGVIDFVNYFYRQDHLSLYRSTHYGGTYIPKQGDFVFFSNKRNWTGRLPAVYGEWGHIGIAVKVEGTILTVIEGNTSDSVRTRTYNLNPSGASKNDRRIAAYGVWY